MTVYIVQGISVSNKCCSWKISMFLALNQCFFLATNQNKLFNRRHWKLSFAISGINYHLIIFHNLFFYFFIFFLYFPIIPTLHSCEVKCIIYRFFMLKYEWMNLTNLSNKFIAYFLLWSNFHLYNNKKGIYFLNKELFLLFLLWKLIAQ